MMDLNLLAQVLAFALPIFSALYCLILLFINLYFNKHDVFTKRLSFLLVIFYCIEIVYSITILFFIHYKDLSNYVIPVYYFSMLLIPVLLYHIIFKITRLRKAEEFNFWHYGIPVFFFLLTSVCIVIISRNIFGSLKGGMDAYPEYKSFVLFLAKLTPFFRLIFSSFYIILSLHRVFTYRKKIKEYSADIGTSSLAWLYKILFCLIILFPITFVHYFSVVGSLFDYVTIVIRLTLIVIFNSILCCNIFSKNFLLLTEDIIFQEKDKISDDNIAGNPIDPVVFEEYMDAEKPYLSHDLKITDLMAPLGTNRTYLSNFINQYYGMNFSTFINTCRMREIEALRSDPYYKGFEEEELVYTAGFKSVKSYQRTKHIISELKG
ncbi:hypothetical protein OHD16_19765 [Sphingobacterium sp. ML3W]|uniref:hypothetical protein n=1 Tax=Sphingobacterium sp. ML3W TaxID=1538644 RepID=UPI00249B43C9|nr:hypothetical protein [Sphingobacterium sp. ML3W]WFA82197.1 hypothetical protein OGI71_12905 [Sphingobacterium sp. ML3W]